jgi:hypothetical protein
MVLVSLSYPGMASAQAVETATSPASAVSPITGTIVVTSKNAALGGREALSFELYWTGFGVAYMRGAPPPRTPDYQIALHDRTLAFEEITGGQAKRVAALDSLTEADLARLAKAFDDLAPPLFESILDTYEGPQFLLRMTGPRKSYHCLTFGCYPARLEVLTAALREIAAQRKEPDKALLSWIDDRTAQVAAAAKWTVAGQRLTIKSTQEWRKIVLSPPKAMHPVFHYGIDDLAESKDPEDRKFLDQTYRELAPRYGPEPKSGNDEVRRLLPYEIAQALARNGDFDYLVEFVQFAFRGFPDDYSKANMLSELSNYPLQTLQSLVQVEYVQKEIAELSKKKKVAEVLNGLETVVTWLKDHRSELRWQSGCWVQVTDKKRGLQQ